ncbi:hypothetical protein PG996_009185 [Apiospora saccharicola]|uniref:Rhodopsin domain-containing protein n=1 Tax=Apiospora saccharicola TaxID=335842 RepID=A0ABR1UMG6_9PEZI
METIVIGAVLTGISTTLVVGRLCNTYDHMKAADYLTIAGWVLSTGYTGIIMAMSGLTRHVWDTPACRYMSDYTWQLLFSQNLLLGITQFMTKAAIFVLYLQLFATSKKTKYAITGGHHFHGHSLPDAPRPDTYIFMIPLLVLRKLQVSRQKKLQLLGVFTVASFGIISSIASCIWRFLVLFGADGDFTWQQGQLFVWIMVEHNVALIVGCMPGFAGLIKTKIPNSSLYQSFRSKLGYGGNSSYGSTNPYNSKPTLPRQSTARSQLAKIDTKRSKRSQYYEMDESVGSPKTQLVSVRYQPDSPKRLLSSEGGGEGGMLRTAHAPQCTCTCQEQQLPPHAR